MDNMTNDDDRTAEETSRDRHAGGIRGDGASPPGTTEVLDDDAAAASVATSGSADVAPDLASARGTPPEEEGDERVTKAKLIEYGRLLVKMKKAARRKARERAAKEKAKGLLTITLKSHKDNRRLVMVFGKKLIITLDRMREANLNTDPLEEGLTKFLQDFYKTQVGPKLK